MLKINAREIEPVAGVSKDGRSAALSFFTASMPGLSIVVAGNPEEVLVLLDKARDELVREIQEGML